MPQLYNCSILHSFLKKMNHFYYEIVFLIHILIVLTMKKIYFLGTCSTNTRILKELQLDNIQMQDIKKDPLTIKQVEEMAELAGSYEALFSRKAMKYRALGLNKQELSEEDYKKYIVQEYTFLKRPVAILDGEIYIGNSKTTIEALTKKLG